MAAMALHGSDNLVDHFRDSPRCHRPDYPESRERVVYWLVSHDGVRKRCVYRFLPCSGCCHARDRHDGVPVLR